MKTQDAAHELMSLWTQQMHAGVFTKLEQMHRGEMMLLHILHRRGGAAPPGELRDISQASFARISIVLGNLEKKRLITRTTDEHDRRRVVARLTEQGRAQVEKAEQAMHAHIAQALDTLGQEDTATLIRLMRSFFEALARQESVPPPSGENPAPPGGCFCGCGAQGHPRGRFVATVQDS